MKDTQYATCTLENLHKSCCVRCSAALVNSQPIWHVQTACCHPAPQRFWCCPSGAQLEAPQQPGNPSTTTPAAYF